MLNNLILNVKDYDLIDRIIADEAFKIDKTKLLEIMNPKNFIGMAPAQTVDFINEEINPILDKNKELLTDSQVELKV